MYSPLECIRLITNLLVLAGCISATHPPLLYAISLEGAQTPREMY